MPTDEMNIDERLKYLRIMQGRYTKADRELKAALLNEDREFRQLARLLGEEGQAFDHSGLVAEDRRYLERRAVTWLVLEGRAWDALPWALVLLDRDRRDPVALDLLDRLEAQLLEGLEAESPRQLQRRFA